MSPHKPRLHADCPIWLVRSFGELGIEAYVTTEPPLVAGPYTMPPMRCPHGIDFWMEPTGEQIAEWVRDKTP